MVCPKCGKITQHSYNGLCQGCYKYFKSGGKVYPLPEAGKVEHDESGKVICHICGRSYNRLGSHIRESHSMTIEEYKAEFGLCSRTKTTEKSYSQTMRENAYKYDMDKRLVEAGKSTRIKLMAGEIKPTEGRVTINGYNVNKLKPGKVPLLRRTLGVVFQDFRLIKKKTAEENVAFAMRVLGAGPVQIRRRVSYVMDLVGLKDKMNSYPTELSGGEQQRVAIARALVNNPSLIIADEPTGNLDPQRSYEIIELLSKINQLGSTVVVITHDYELLRRFAKRVIYMNQGSLVMDKVLRPGEEEAQ